MNMLRTLGTAAVIALAGLSSAYAEGMPFRITLNTGPNHVRNIALEEFVTKLTERTEGQLDVQVFSSGQLYKGPDVPKALAQGAVEMGVPIVNYISSVVPNAGLLDLPIFYGRSIEDIHKVTDGPVGEELTAEIEAKLNVKVIGKYLDLGHGSLFTTQTPVSSLSDLDGLRLRVPGSPAAKVRYDNMGVESIAISFADVPIALAQGTVDGLMTTHETIRSAKLWESGLKYAVDTQGAFLLYIPMIGKPTWDNLDADLQQTILDTWAETVDDARALAAQRQKEAREENIANGIETVQADPAELAAFRDNLVKQQDSIVEAVRMDPEFVARAAAALED